MTDNQLKYLAFQETQRHNLAMEEDTDIANRETARSNQAREDETQRANIAKESETERSNIARETETNRSNVINEIEAHRSNTAREAETHRHNLMSEGIEIADTILKGVGEANKFVGHIVDLVPDEFSVKLFDDLLSLF